MTSMEELEKIILAAENGGMLAEEEPRRASFLFPVPRPAPDQLLLQACFNGDLEAVKRLLQTDSTLIAQRDAGGMGPMLTATHKNHLEIVKTLLDSGGNLSESDSTETTVLCYSIVLGYHKISKLLLRRGASPIGDPKVSDQNRPIHFAAVGGHIKFCKYLIKKGATLMDKGLSDGTPCRSAVIANNLNFVKWAIETEPNVYTAKDTNGLGLVVSSVESGATSVLRWFVEEKKEDLVALRGMFDLTMVQLAARSGAVEILRWLLKWGHPKDEKWGDAGLSPVQLAAQEGRRECIQLLLDSGVDVARDTDTAKTTCLHWAAHAGHYKLIPYLLELGCAIDAVDSAAVTPLMYAAQNGHLQAVEELVAKGAEIDKISDDQKTPFLYACASSDFKCARFFAKRGADTHKTSFGQNGLLLAARKNRKETVEWLLKKWPDLAEGRDADGDSALALAYNNGFMELGQWFLDHPEYGLTLEDPSLVNSVRMAAGNGLLEPITFLHSKGIPIDQADAAGNTPLAFAAHFGFSEGIEFLVKNGADLERLSDTFHPIHFAARQGRLAAYQTMVKIGADYKALVDGSGETVLHMACQSGCVPLVEFMLEQGLNHSHLAVGPSGNYPILNAAISGHLDVMNVLTKAGAKWDVKAKNGWTPAFYAAASGFLDILKECQEKGLSLVEKDAQGYTPLLLAAYNGEDHIVRWLLAQGGASLTDYYESNGYNAISMAIQGGELSTVKMLIDEFHMPTHWPVPNETKTHGTVCGKYGKADIFEWLASNGHIKVTPLPEDTDPLFEACAAGHLPFVKMLHRIGYPLNLIINGTTPFMFSCHSNHVPLIRWFLRQGVSPLQWDSTGNSSWSYAERDGDVEELILPLVRHAT